MAGRTYIRFPVQPFQRRGKLLEAQAIREGSDEAAAVRLAERLAARSAGVLVVRLAVDRATGEHDDPVILVVHGQVPPHNDDTQP